ncbi:hypothetical protein LTR08_002670 [Meristemomyces frigidus]|nr:hypothetical protein LTR08_002670 [Meristemomyces frigidus]
MAPRKPKTKAITAPRHTAVRDDARKINSASDDSAADSNATDAAPNALDEEEFHTDASDEEDNADEDDAPPPPPAPYLPAHLLAQSTQPTPHIARPPWAQMTPQQKRSQRRQEYRVQKRVRDGLQASGVVQAQRVSTQPRLVAGRVGKSRSGNVKREVSGRQILLEERKRAMVGKGVVSVAGKRARVGGARKR